MNTFRIYTVKEWQLGDYIGQGVIDNEFIRVHLFEDSYNSNLFEEELKNLSKDFIAGICYIDNQKYWIIMDLKNEEIIDKIESQKSTNQRNLIGCSENWYNPLYSIKEVFSKEELEEMSNKELIDLIRLASVISEGLY